MVLLGEKKNQLFWGSKKKLKLVTTKVKLLFLTGMEYQNKKKINYIYIYKKYIYIYLYLEKISEDFRKTILNVEIL